MPPAYYKYGDSEVIEFYKKIVESVPECKIILYNFEKLCGYKFSVGGDFEVTGTSTISVDNINLTNNTRTQEMLDNGITLNSYIDVANCDSKPGNCEGRSGDADSHTICTSALCKSIFCSACFALMLCDQILITPPSTVDPSIVIISNGIVTPLYLIGLFLVLLFFY